MVKILNSRIRSLKIRDVPFATEIIVTDLLWRNRIFHYKSSGSGEGKNYVLPSCTIQSGITSLYSLIIGKEKHNNISKITDVLWYL